MRATPVFLLLVKRFIDPGTTYLEIVLDALDRKSLAFPRPELKVRANSSSPLTEDYGMSQSA